jgi:hypothetical protein
MSAVGELWAGIWKDRRQPPSAIAIPADHVLEGSPLEAELEPNRDYFQVRVNQLFLSSSRKWFSKIEPMVFSLAEFTYAGAPAVVPYVVGPGKLKSLGVKEPLGMIYGDSRVAGTHPYAGGKISFALVLCQVSIDNVANRWLRVVEGAAQAFDFATMLVPYVKVGRAVLDGVQELLGLSGTEPLLGWQQEFDRDGGLPLTPGFFALIDAADVDPGTLWVKGSPHRQLWEGSSKDELTPFRGADFALFSIAHPPDGRRTDLSEDGKKSLQAHLTALEQSILLSPDLTESDKNTLADEYAEKANALRQRAIGHTVRDAGAPADPLAAVRARSLRAAQRIT